MLLGSRVIRGPDWSWGDQDGGEGSVGTIISLSDFDEGTPLFRGTVLVCWDNGFRGGYRIGLDGCYDLRLIDTGMIFPSVSCDECDKYPIYGMNWNCSECHDYHLCTQCYMEDKHILDHTFICRLFEDHQGIFVLERSASTKTKTRGIYPGAQVTPIDETALWLGAGIVTTCTDEHGSCTVYWDNVDEQMQHKLGHNGEVELKLVQSADGPMYYIEHLPLVVSDIDKHPPILGCTQQQYIHGQELTCEAIANENNPDQVLYEGDKVVVHLLEDVAVMRNSGMSEMEVAQLVGEIGRISKINEKGVVTVEYDKHQPMDFFDTNVLAKIPKLRVGDVVRLTNNIVALRKLQQDHKGFNDDMEKDLNKVGNVKEINAEGTVKIEFDGYFWWFNPAVLKLLSKEEDRVPLDPSDKETGGAGSTVAEQPSYKFADFLAAIGQGCQEFAEDIVTNGPKVLQNIQEKVAQDYLHVVNKGALFLQNETQNLVRETAIFQEQQALPTEQNITGEPETSGPEESVLVRASSSTSLRILDPYDETDNYKMNSNQKGLVVMINIQTFTGTDLQDREGSDKDANDFLDLFVEYLNFTPIIFEDNCKKRSDLLRELRRISEDEEYREYDCLAVCIMSHGKNGIFYAADGIEVKVKQVFTIFINADNAVFQNKPKLFFMQACRGTMGGEFSIQSDDPSSNLSDILLAYPSCAGYKAWRDINEGSYFIQSIVEVFREYAEREHIAEMLPRVHRKVCQKVVPGMTQIPAHESTLQKHLYFWPGMDFEL